MQNKLRFLRWLQIEKCILRFDHQLKDKKERKTRAAN